jgi:hypothetical protein
MSTLLVDNLGVTSGNAILARTPNVFYWPGAHVQTVFNLCETRAYYYVPNNDGGQRANYGPNYSRQGGVPISQLNLTIAPTSNRSWVQIEFNIFYETNENIIFNVLRDGQLISSPNIVDQPATNTTGRWVGAGVSRYDNNGDSTPSYIQLNWMDQPGTIEPVTYSVAVISSNGSEYAFTLNSTLSNYQFGGDAYEQGVSFTIANEIAR